MTPWQAVIQPQIGTPALSLRLSKGKNPVMDWPSVQPQFDARPEAADGHRELRRQEGISQGRRGPLHGLPYGNLQMIPARVGRSRYSHGPG